MPFPFRISIIKEIRNASSNGKDTLIEPDRLLIKFNLQISLTSITSMASLNLKRRIYSLYKYSGNNNRLQ